MFILMKKVIDVIVMVMKDDIKVKEVIKFWVDVYNLLVDIFSLLIKYIVVELGEEVSDKNGVLLGDSVVCIIQIGIWV